MKKITGLYILGFFFFALLDSCIPTEYQAKVTTSDISDITKNSAICGGNITTDGGDAILERGLLECK